MPHDYPSLLQTLRRSPVLAILYVTLPHILANLLKGFSNLRLRVVPSVHWQVFGRQSRTARGFSKSSKIMLESLEQVQLVGGLSDGQSLPSFSNLRLKNLSLSFILAKSISTFRSSESSVAGQWQLDGLQFFNVFTFKGAISVLPSWQVQTSGVTGSELLFMKSKGEAENKNLIRNFYRILSPNLHLLILLNQRESVAHARRRILKSSRSV